MLSTFTNVLTYLLITIIAILFYKTLDRPSKKIQLIDIVMMLLLIIITGARFDVGTDYLAYLDKFNEINVNFINVTTIFEEETEIGILLLSYILKNITTNEYVFFWGVSIIIYPLLIVYFRKKTKIVWFAFATFIFLGFFDVSMNILRQQIAMVFILFSYEFLIEKKHLKFILITALAAIFHTTSILAALLLILSRFIKPTYKNLFYSILIGIVGYIFYKYLLLKIFSYNTIFSKYENYISAQDGSLLRGLRIYSIIGYAIVFILLTFIILSKNNNLKKVLKERHQMISLLFIGIVINIIAIDYWVLNRIALYMYQFIIVLLPAYFTVQMNKQERLISIFIISMIFINWFIIFFIFGGNNISHTYNTYLFK